MRISNLILQDDWPKSEKCCQTKCLNDGVGCWGYGYVPGPRGTRKCNFFSGYGFEGVDSNPIVIAASSWDLKAPYLKLKPLQAYSTLKVLPVLETCSKLSKKCSKSLTASLKIRDEVEWDIITEQFVNAHKPVWPDRYGRWNPSTCNPCNNGAAGNWRRTRTAAGLEKIFSYLDLGNSDLQWHEPCHLGIMKRAFALYSTTAFNLLASLTLKPIDYAGESSTFLDNRYGYVVKATIARASQFPEKNGVSDWALVLKVSCLQACGTWKTYRELLCTASADGKVEPNTHPVKAAYGCSKSGCICSVFNTHYCPYYKDTCNTTQADGFYKKPWTTTRDENFVHHIGKDDTRCSKKQQFKNRLAFKSVKCNTKDKGFEVSKAIERVFLMQ